VKKLIKKWLKLYDQQDFDRACSEITSAKDREDFEWKLKQKLFKK